MAGAQTPTVRTCPDKPQAQALLQHPQLGPGRIHLLAQLGVRSLKELLRRNPASLAARLNKLNQELGLLQETYSPGQMQKWQDEARLQLSKQSPQTILQIRSSQDNDHQTGFSSAPEWEIMPVCSLALPERLELAQKPGLPVSIALQLSRDTHPSVRRALLDQPDLSTVILHLLAKDPAVSIQQAVLAHPGADRQCLTLLARHPAAEIRVRVAAHPLCHVGLLSILAQDPETPVRLAVASNPVSSARVLTRFRLDPQAGIRLAAVMHPQASHGLLGHFLKDPNLQVRKAVAQLTPVLRHQVVLSKDKSVEIRRIMAGRRLAPELLAILAQDPDGSVRRLIASNPGTALTSLNHLAKDPDQTVRAAVAAHPGCPPELLDGLAQDAEHSVKQAILKHPEVSLKLREQLLTSGLNLDLQLQVARDPRTPTTILELLACLSEHEVVRQNLLLHPAFPSDMLQILWFKGLSESALRELIRHPELNHELREQIINWQS